MLAETIQLETLRQKIEDVEYEAGDRSDYLDRGQPNSSQAKQAKELIDKLSNQSKALKAQLKELITTVRVQQPQAIEEWVNFHAGILQKIVDEQTTGTMAAVRRDVAKRTLEEWEKVRAGEQEYANINWHYLKDYKASVRKIGGKAWWQFWK